MSRVYIARLEKIGKEFEATRFALSYFVLHWNNSAVVKFLAQSVGPAPSSRDGFVEAANRLEETFFVRLTAEFEGVLKDHLRSNHSHINVVDNPKVDWLINKVKKVEAFRISPALQRKLQEARDYRNIIAHQDAGRGVARVPFRETLARYSRFLAQLPDPLKK